MDTQPWSSSLHWITASYPHDSGWWLSLPTPGSRLWLVTASVCIRGESEGRLARREGGGWSACALFDLPQPIGVLGWLLRLPL